MANLIFTSPYRFLDICWVQLPRTIVSVAPQNSLSVLFELARLPGSSTDRLYSTGMIDPAKYMFVRTDKKELFRTFATVGESLAI